MKLWKLLKINPWMKEFREMAQEELKRAKASKEELEEKLQILFIA